MLYVGPVPLGGQGLLQWELVESDNIKAVFNAIDAAHQAVISAGVKRIVSNIKIFERLDASRTLEAEVKSVTDKLTE
jgi:uncharacterized protein YqgV (UPF0045/DUF77 family)